MVYDLHIHSNYSDGQYSPEDIVDLAVNKGLQGISISDHDNLDAIKIAKDYIEKNNINLDLIPGIEFGSNYGDEEVHILGYFIDYQNPKLLKAIDKLKKWREVRSIKILKKLEDRLNIQIDIEDVNAQSEKGFTGRVPIAKTLVQKGYVDSIGEAFDKYLAIGKAAYEEKDNFTCKEIINLIQTSNGVAILAHPILLKNSMTMDYIVSLGIDGIECYHSKHSNLESEYFVKYAKSRNLLITGGSDCHGRKNKDNEILLGKYYIDEYNLKKMEELHNERKNK